MSDRPMTREPEATLLDAFLRAQNTDLAALPQWLQAIPADVWPAFAEASTYELAQQLAGITAATVHRPAGSSAVIDLLSACHIRLELKQEFIDAEVQRRGKRASQGERTRALRYSA